MREWRRSWFACAGVGGKSRNNRRNNRKSNRKRRIGESGTGSGKRPCRAGKIGKRRRNPPQPTGPRFPHGHMQPCHRRSLKRRQRHPRQHHPGQGTGPDRRQPLARIPLFRIRRQQIHHQNQRHRFLIRQRNDADSPHLQPPGQRWRRTGLNLTLRRCPADHLIIGHQPGAGRHQPQGQIRFAAAGSSAQQHSSAFNSNTGCMNKDHGGAACPQPARLSIHPCRATPGFSRQQDFPDRLSGRRLARVVAPCCRKESAAPDLRFSDREPFAPGESQG